MSLGVLTLGAVRLNGSEYVNKNPGYREDISGEKDYGRPYPLVSDSYNSKEAREQHCHRVQEKIYWVTYILISGFTLGTAAAAAYFASLAYNAAVEQTSIARQAFIESDRPIVDIAFSDSDVLGKARAYKPNIKILISNIGGKPGYVRTILSNVKAGTDIIGHCDGILGSRMVQSSGGLATPCIIQTLNATQVLRIGDTINFLSVSGYVNYRSLSGFCWLKKFKFYWADTNEFSPAHFYPDATEKTNDESSVNCSETFALDD